MRFLHQDATDVLLIKPLWSIFQPEDTGTSDVILTYRHAGGVCAPPHLGRGLAFPIQIGADEKTALNPIPCDRPAARRPSCGR
jgi:hypothetical protein